MESIKTFVVLGMHRSATSLIAKSLNSEIHMGKELLFVPHENHFGHFENIDFIKLNKRILKRAGGSWEDPPALFNILDQKDFFSQEIEQLIKRSEKPLWGWKDPRTVLTIDLYVPYLTNPHYICCFRDPSQVAQSLFVRNKMPLNEGISLANEYNSRIMKFMSSQYGVDK